MTQAANLGALGTNVNSSGVTQVGGGGTAGTGGAIGFKNRIINGAMVINQRATSVTATGYTVDRWSYNGSQTSKATVAQSSTAPTGFINSLGVTSSSAYSITSGDYFTLEQPVEGLNCTDLAWGTANAKTVTLSFQVQSSLTGTFGGVLYAGTGSYSYPFSYTISSANTWTAISVTIAGPTSGTFVTTNATCFIVCFGLGVGSTYSGTAGSWQASVLRSVTGATSVVGTNGATFYITGVQLEVGTAATNFDVRSYGTELGLCYRYYQKLTSGGASGNYAGFGSGACGSSTIFFVYIQVAPKRTSPTVTTSGTTRILDGVNAYVVTGLPGDSYFSTSGNGYLNVNSTGMTAGRPAVFTANNDANAFVAFSSEL